MYYVRYKLICVSLYMLHYMCTTVRRTSSKYMSSQESRNDLKKMVNCDSCSCPYLQIHDYATQAAILLQQGQLRRSHTSPVPSSKRPKKQSTTCHAVNLQYVYSKIPQVGITNYISGCSMVIYWTIDIKLPGNIIANGKYAAGPNSCPTVNDSCYRLLWCFVHINRRR